MRRIKFSLVACAAFATSALAGCASTSTSFGSSATNSTTTVAPPAADGQPAPNVHQLLAMLVQQLHGCWNPGLGLPAVKVRLELNLDGTLVRDPVIVPDQSSDTGSAQFKAAAQSALRAVRTCAPFRLPAAQYDEWKVLEIDFR